MHEDHRNRWQNASEFIRKLTESHNVHMPQASGVYIGFYDFIFGATYIEVQSVVQEKMNTSFSSVSSVAVKETQNRIASLATKL